MGPPSAPQHPDEHGIDNQGKGPGDPPGPPGPGRRHGGLGDPGTWQEASLTPGNQPPARKEDKLASPGWKLLEDLGAKMMEAPRGDTVGKGVILCPPARQKVGDRT